MAWGRLLRQNSLPLVALSSLLAAPSIALLDGSGLPPASVEPIRIGDTFTYVVHLRDVHGEVTKTTRYSVDAAGPILGRDHRSRDAVAIIVETPDSVRRAWIDRATLMEFRRDFPQTNSRELGGYWAGSKELTTYVLPQNTPAVSALLSFAGTTITGDIAWTSLIDHLLPVDVATFSGSESGSVVAGVVGGVPVFVLTQRLVAKDGPQRLIDAEAIVAPSIPYPLRLRISARDGIGVPVAEQTWSLAAFTRGQTKLTPASHLDASPSLPRPTNSSYPSDGKGPAVTYPVEDALEQLMNDPAVVGFHSWRLLRPGARLVGYSLVPWEFDGLNNDPEQPALRTEWAFRFADAQGRSVLVLVGRDEQTGTVWYKDAKGELQLPTGVMSSMPAEFISIADALRTWKLVRGERAHLGEANMLDWGLVHCDPMVGGSCSADLFNTLVVGHHGAIRAATSGVPGPEAEYSRLALDARSGVLRSFETTQGAALLLEHEASAFEGAKSFVAGEPRIFPKTRGDFDVVVLVVSLTGLGFLLAEAARRLASGVLVAAYAKITGAKLLQHETRERIMQYVHANPGATPVAMAGRDLAPWSTLAYHLRRLEQDSLLRVVRVGPSKRYYDAATVSPAAAKRDATLRELRSQQILALVTNLPGRSLSEIAATMGIKPPSLLPHLRRLIAIGVLRAERRGRATEYYPQGSV